VKRHELLGHLRRHGCRLAREGGHHTIFTNPSNGVKVPFRGMVRSITASIARSANGSAVRRPVSTTLPEADSIPFNDPQFTHRASLIQNCRNPPHVRYDSFLILRLQPEHDNPGVLIRRICPNIREIQIKSNENPALGASASHNRPIIGAREGLVLNGFGIEATIS
jgi:hypothetical protein